MTVPGVDRPRDLAGYEVSSPDGAQSSRSLKLLGGQMRVMDGNASQSVPAARLTLCKTLPPNRCTRGR